MTELQSLMLVVSLTSFLGGGFFGAWIASRKYEEFLMELNLVEIQQKLLDKDTKN
jgi:hypothetical protein